MQSIYYDVLYRTDHVGFESCTHVSCPTPTSPVSKTLQQISLCFHWAMTVFTAMQSYGNVTIHWYNPLHNRWFIACNHVCGNAHLEERLGAFPHPWLQASRGDRCIAFFLPCSYQVIWVWFDWLMVTNIHHYHPYPRTFIELARSLHNCLFSAVFVALYIDMFVQFSMFSNQDFFGLPLSPFLVHFYALLCGQNFKLFPMSCDVAEQALQ